MLRYSRILSWSLAVSSWTLSGSFGMAKGLNELSQSNPAQEAVNSDDSDEDGNEENTSKPASQGENGKGEKVGAPNAPKPTVQVEKSEVSKAIAGRLSMGTSYGWVFGSRSTGKWSARGGTSDVSIGYKLRTLATVYDLIGTYRYVPFVVQGEQDFQSYRGTWQVHYIGGKFARQVKNILTFGMLEVGYVAAQALSTDGLAEKSNVQDGGAALAIGGGADFKLVDQFFVGPRLNVSVGSIRTVQLAGAASFAF
jgi:hypothetical protein